MTTRHTVSIGDISSKPIEIELAGSYGKGSHKTLKARVNLADNNVDYAVYEKNIEICAYLDIEEAILRYNRLD